MGTTPDSKHDLTALCLSGGGFRATLFHLGALRRLNELGILSRIDAFSSVSGGSITAAVLATRWEELKRSESGGVFTRFERLVGQPIRDFCRNDLRTDVLLWQRADPRSWWRLLRRDQTATDGLAAAYAGGLGLDRPLSALPLVPTFIFCAANLENGASWEFRAGRMGDFYTGWTATGGFGWFRSTRRCCYRMYWPPRCWNPEEFHGPTLRTTARKCWK